MNDRNPNNKGLEASVGERRRGVLESQAVGALGKGTEASAFPLPSAIL
jgi:hypothetical protein